MTVLSDTIRLRADSGMVAAAESWAKLRGETLSGLVRRLLAAEVPGVEPDSAPLDFSDPAVLLSDIMAGVDGATHRLLRCVGYGTDQERHALLVALAGYLIWEYRAPPDPGEVQDIIRETERILSADYAAGTC